MATLCAKQAFERVAASVETGSQLPFAACSSSGYYADKPETRDFLANGYFSKATLAVEIIKVRFGVKYSTTGLITLVILINGQPV
jgi:hypothetical protein